MSSIRGKPVAGIAVQHLEHLAADALDDLALRGVQLFVEVIIAPLQAARQQLALALQFGLLVVAQRARPIRHFALKFFDLLLKGLQFVLFRRELRLQLRLRLLALRRGHNGVPDIDDGDLRRGRRSAGGALRMDAASRSQTDSASAAKVPKLRELTIILTPSFPFRKSQIADYSGPYSRASIGIASPARRDRTNANPLPVLEPMHSSDPASWPPAPSAARARTTRARSPYPR